jgi:hypothetical protein
MLGALAVAGCAGERSPPDAAGSRSGAAPTNDPASDRSLIVIPDEGLNGEVTWVNTSLRFVVITFPVGHLPALDQRLSVYRRELKVGDVKICGPQRDDSIVADVLSGEANVGDVIRDR